MNKRFTIESDEGVDRAVKVLMREFPNALFLLADLPIPTGKLTPGDVAINLPEMRADHVFLLPGGRGRNRRAVYFEYQLYPDSRVLPDWFCKCGSLSKQLGRQVVLVVIYLERGRYRLFPDRYETAVGSISNEFVFQTVRLWEHADRIRSGELGVLAPLLPLCETTPDEQTLRTQRSLIRTQARTQAEAAELIGLSLLIGTRRFPRELMSQIFAEDLEMAKTSGIVADWIEEGRAEGRAEGEARGLSLGRTENAREFALRLLRERYPSLPAPVVERIGREGVEWCEELAVRLVRGEPLTDIGL